MVDVPYLLSIAVSRNASDLHLAPRRPPTLRVDGELVPVDGAENLSGEDTLKAIRIILSDKQYEVFSRKRSIDLGYTCAFNGGTVRFRVNAYYEKGQVSIAFRKLADQILDLEGLNLPVALGNLTDLRDGLVLVTGPTGSGKTTTLATLIDMINETQACHILTIEDPMEYTHEHKKSIVSQRELYTDVDSFSDALRYGLREDPDVILVGEMRDLDTMRMAIMAAETGHLVFSSLHSRDAVSSVNRIVGVFPQGEQEQIRHQLSTTLKAVVSQRLLPRADIRGRIPAVEVMIVTPAISNLIRISKNEQLYSAIETGVRVGMQTMEQSLCNLYQSGKINRATMFKNAKSSVLIEERLRHSGR